MQHRSHALICYDINADCTAATAEIVAQLVHAYMDEAEFHAFECICVVLLHTCWHSTPIGL